MDFRIVLIPVCVGLAIRPDAAVALRGMSLDEGSLVDPYYVGAIRFAAIVSLVAILLSFLVKA